MAARQGQGSQGYVQKQDGSRAEGVDWLHPALEVLLPRLDRRLWLRGQKLVENLQREARP